MKHGTTLGSMLLSSSELDKYFPDRKVGLWAGTWNMAEIKVHGFFIAVELFFFYDVHFECRAVGIVLN